MFWKQGQVKAIWFGKNYAGIAASEGEEGLAMRIKSRMPSMILQIAHRGILY